MSTLYRCDTCGKLLRHCAPHSREIAPPVVLRGVPEFHAENTWCSIECAVAWLHKFTAGRALEVFVNAGTTPGGNAVQNDAP